MSTGSVVPFGWGGSMLPRHTSNDDPFIRLWNDVDRLFGDVMQGAQGTGPAGWRPAGTIGLPLEVRETGAELRVVAELPGVEAGDLEVHAHRDTLTIRGGRRPAAEDEQAYHRRERRSGVFTRTLQLPYRVDPGRVEARLEDGVLRLSLGRPEEDKPRRIEIKA